MNETMGDILPLKIPFAPLRRASTAEAIVDQVKALIRENSARPGTKLPSERKLAQELGVSRATLREALRMLTMIGLVDTRHGTGSAIAESPAPVVDRMMELMVLLEKPSARMLHETREVIEIALAEKAAENRTAEDLRAMRTGLDALASAVDDRKRFVELDAHFHELIYRASRNSILCHLMTCLRRQLRDIIARSVEVQNDLRPSIGEHERIFIAIRDRDAAAARAAMTAHMATVLDELRRAGLVR